MLLTRPQPGETMDKSRQVPPWLIPTAWALWLLLALGTMMYALTEPSRQTSRRAEIDASIAGEKLYLYERDLAAASSAQAARAARDNYFTYYRLLRAEGRSHAEARQQGEGLRESEVDPAVQQARFDSVLAMTARTSLRHTMNSKARWLAVARRRSSTIQLSAAGMLIVSLALLIPASFRHYRNDAALGKRGSAPSDNAA